MTAEIIDLRRARKAKVRANREAQARENRAQFGRSKVERARVNAERERAARDLDGAQVSPVAERPPPSKA